ncbi:hypothetical protein [Actinacidiphila glaucinigra]|uniref:Uncharacterized protein n=1 Tax=Actinacidiphila glaucinigra TaxID=235986 RepID=A0A239MEK7_9ACTN|nr:hypothetical protein [Actinacidiphila glaucinigra]SNT40408.1 hypothetical protein SAMN05216252_123151 [Actinacidiphila glaucinigra]
MERDLPVLLERILPQLALPSDRMAQVRRRIQQRKRRRRAAAAASVLAVGCAVVATVLSPAAFGPEEHRAVPAAAPTGDPGFAQVRLEDPLDGVTVYLPTTWHTLSVRDDHGAAAGFVSSQTLHVPGDGTCPSVTDAVLTACPPLTGLNQKGVLITFLSGDANSTDDAGSLARGVPVSADGNCRAVGGDRQMTGWAHGRAPGSAGGPDMKIDVCLKEPSQLTLVTVAKVLTLLRVSADQG